MTRLLILFIFVQLILFTYSSNVHIDQNTNLANIDGLLEHYEKYRNEAYDDMMDSTLDSAKPIPSLEPHDKWAAVNVKEEHYNQMLENSENNYESDEDYDMMDVDINNKDDASSKKRNYDYYYDGPRSGELNENIDPETGEMKRKLYKSFDFEVFGKVQGVWFRVNTKKEAESLDINGWVANTSRGTVVGHAEGLDSDLKEFRLWICEIGPKLSRVSKCKITNEENNKRQLEFNSFEIDYDYEYKHSGKDDL